MDTNKPRDTFNCCKLQFEPVLKSKSYIQKFKELSNKTGEYKFVIMKKRQAKNKLTGKKVKKSDRKKGPKEFVSVREEDENNCGWKLKTYVRGMVRGEEDSDSEDSSDSDSDSDSDGDSDSDEGEKKKKKKQMKKKQKKQNASDSDDSSDASSDEDSSDEDSD